MINRGYTMRLSEAKVGDVLKIMHINIKNKKLKQHLLDMGLVKNTIIKINKVAPLGDPISIELRNYELCLSKKDVVDIIVEKI